jgi:transcriptional regulator with XRE-family HTH domain
MTVSENLFTAPPPLYTSADQRYQTVLELAADYLLEAHALAPSAPYPCVSESRLESHRFGPTVAAPAPTRPEVAGRARVVVELLGRLPLDKRGRLIFRLLARGYTGRQIADRLGLSGSMVSYLKQSVCRALAEVTSEERDFLLSPGLALQETYRLDLARRGYVEEKHCPSGHEACRQTGQCDRRWYLYLDPDDPQAPGES